MKSIVQYIYAIGIFTFIAITVHTPLWASDSKAPFTPLYMDIPLGCAELVSSSPYCNLPITHNGNEAEVASAINLTVENTGPTSLTFTITSADGDPVDELLVIDITPAAQSNDIDMSVAGQLSRTVTWDIAPTMPIEFQVLWSKESFGGNWQYIPNGDPKATIELDAVCDNTSGPSSPFCEQEVTHFGIEAEVASMVLFTAENSGSNEMKFEIMSADADPVDDFLIIDVVPAATSNTLDNSVSGVLTRTLSWDTPPTDVEFQMLWSKVSNAGNWQLTHPDDPKSSIPFEAVCTPVQEVLPTEAAPTPSCESADVISLFSNAYTDETIETWRTDWSAGSELTDLMVAGDDVKRYEGLNFFGVQIPPSNIDASAMTTFHIDIWTPDITTFRVKLVDAGPNGTIDGAGSDDSEHEIVIESPAQNEWVSLDIPLSDFTGLNSAEQISQLVFSGLPVGDGLLFIDNVYFSNSNCAAQNEPYTIAPIPSACDPAAVISLYGENFENHNVDTYRTTWSDATLVTDKTINGHPVLFYENLNFVGIEFIAEQVDASALTHLYLDYWTPNMTELKVKLVDFGADAAFGGGDDTEHELVISNPVQNQWTTLAIPFSDLTGLTSFTNLAQLIFSGSPVGTSTLSIDNLYFKGNCNPIPACPELVWADEFDGSTLDNTKWSHQIGDGCDIGLCGWGNNELQYYQEANTEVSNGVLTITAKEESVGGRAYTSSRIRTINMGDWVYGRFEASIKIPEGQGLWPAFWMLPTDEVYGIWPQSGEIDIMENVGDEFSEIFGTIHFGQLFPNNQSSESRYEKLNGKFSDDFHVFAIEWEENEIRWYVDDYLYATKTPADLNGQNWPFDQRFHIIMNVAVGGNFPGDPDETTVFPQTMEVEYVRVYEGQFPHIVGEREVAFMASGETYTIENAGENSTYNWTVPDGATIVSGQGTPSITVDWGEASGDIMVDVTSDCETETLNLFVHVDEFKIETLDCVLENYDDEAIIYYLSSSGTLTEDVPNPDPTGNTSALVGQYDRNSAEVFDVLSFGTHPFDNANDFVEGSQKIKIDIWTEAPIGTPIILQFENRYITTPFNFPAGRHSRYQAETTKQGEWETLTFEFLDQPVEGVDPTSINDLIILFDPANNSGDTYYIDNIEKYCMDTEEICLAEDSSVAVVECAFENYDIDPLITVDVATGTYTEDVPNPSIDAINSSELVGQYIRNAGDLFDNIQFTTDAITDASVFVSGAQEFFIDVLSDVPAGTNIVIQLEDTDMVGNFPAGRHSRYSGYTAKQGEWETVDFKFLDRPDGNIADDAVDRIVILFDLNTNNPGEYYIDNFDKVCVGEASACHKELGFTLVDPCNCDNPNNILLDDGSVLFVDTIMIDASSFIAPTVEIESADENFLDATGEPMNPADAEIIDMGEGAYAVEFYTRTGSPASVVVSVNGQLEEIITSSCRPCNEEIIPTLGEWGIIMIALLLLIIGLVTMRVPAWVTE